MKVLTVLNDILITDISADGAGVGRYDNQVVFVDFSVPGDRVDVKVYRSKKNYHRASVIAINKVSDFRSEPFCKHFGICGGCQLQHLTYQAQLKYKEKQVDAALKRIGHQTNYKTEPILPSPLQMEYRNRLDFAFSNRRYLSAEEIESGITNEGHAAGFHRPHTYDKVVDIETCHLMPALNNEIRQAVKAFALEHHLTFYDYRLHQGLLRGMIIRNTSEKDWMLIMIFGRDEPNKINLLMEFVVKTFPQLRSVWYVVNTKRNDTIYDLPMQLYKGDRYLMTEIDGMQFRISPRAFFQTNSKQAEQLFRLTIDYAGILPSSRVYDFYCGTGTLSCLAARRASHVTGIESVPETVEDARENARLNGLANVTFITGDLKDLLTNEFFSLYGKPDIIITDPPRAGMHPAVIRAINRSEALRVVYVSCNAATQARDIAMMDNYSLEKIRPVDMFPHTLHVENVALLIKKDNSV
jgi:23S rRNA (uracil1939-C5)-methyltransferase